MRDERTIGRTQPQYPSGTNWLVLIAFAIVVGFVCGIVVTALIVISIDPASGMGI